MKQELITYPIHNERTDTSAAIIQIGYRPKMQKLARYSDRRRSTQKAAVINIASSTQTDTIKRATYIEDGEMDRNNQYNLSTGHIQPDHPTDSTEKNQARNSLLKYKTDAATPIQLGILRGLSPAGLNFQLSEKLETNQIINVTCDAVTAVARVIYCRERFTKGLYEVELEFITSCFSKRCGTFFSAVVR